MKKNKENQCTIELFELGLFIIRFRDGIIVFRNKPLCLFPMETNGALCIR